MTQVPPPGVKNQDTTRSVLRIAGAIAALVGVVLVVLAFADFFSVMSAGPAGMATTGLPSKFFLAFIGLPLLGAGISMLRAGYLGVATKYVAGETIPTVKQSLEYLTDGQGVDNLGRTAPPSGQPAAGPFCRACGTRNDVDAAFCDSCGASLA